MRVAAEEGQAVTEYAIALGVLVGVAVAAASTGVAQAIVEKVGRVLLGI